jgi:hypothetical protein
MLEGVREIGEQAALVEELRRLEMLESPPEGMGGSPATSSSSANGTSRPMTAAAWRRRLSSGGRRSRNAWVWESIQ